jgi:hypothetical protein
MNPPVSDSNSLTLPSNSQCGVRTVRIESKAKQNHPPLFCLLQGKKPASFPRFSSPVARPFQANLELCHGPRRDSAQISSEPCPLRRTEWQSPSRKPLVSAVGKGRGTSSLLHFALKSQSSDLFEMPIRRLLGLSAAASGHLRRGLSTAAERPPWAMIYHAILDKSPG